MDPMCGSGTIPIEAGTIAQGIAPGLHRTFGFEEWPCHDPQHLESIRRDAAAQSVLGDTLILGGDKNEKAIDAAIHNVERAGLTGPCFFQCSPFKALQSPGQPGLILTNPPYGHRIGDQQGLGDMYGYLRTCFEATVGRVACCNAGARFTSETSDWHTDGADCNI